MYFLYQSNPSLINFSIINYQIISAQTKKIMYLIHMISQFYFTFTICILNYWISMKTFNFMLNLILLIISNYVFAFACH